MSKRKTTTPFDEIVAIGERRSDYEKYLGAMALPLMREEMIARHIARAPKHTRKKLREWYEQNELRRLSVIEAVNGTNRTPAEQHAAVVAILADLIDVEPAMQPVLKLVQTLGPKVITDPTEHIRRDVEARAAKEGRIADGKRGAQSNRKLQPGHAEALLALDAAREGEIHISFETFAVQHGRDTGQAHVQKFEGRKAGADGDRRMTERGLVTFLRRQNYLSESSILTPDDVRRGREFQLGKRRQALEEIARAFRRAE